MLHFFFPSGVPGSWDNNMSFRGDKTQPKMRAPAHVEDGALKLWGHPDTAGNLEELEIQLSSGQVPGVWRGLLRETQARLCMTKASPTSVILDEGVAQTALFHGRCKHTPLTQGKPKGSSLAKHSEPILGTLLACRTPSFYAM